MLHSKQGPGKGSKVFFSIFLSACMMIGAVAVAQLPGQPQQEVKEDFSKEELEQFVDANKVVAGVQRSSEEKMVKAIEEEGLEVQQFNEILTTQQNPEAEAEVSDDDLNKFNKAVEKVMKVQQDMQTDLQKAIEESGMTVQKYDQILIAYQQSPKVQEEVNKILQDRQ